MTMENGEKVWQLLIERLDQMDRTAEARHMTLSQKLDRLGGCHGDLATEFERCRAEKGEELSTHRAAFKWLFGIVAVIAAALIVQTVMG